MANGFKMALLLAAAVLPGCVSPAFAQVAGAAQVAPSPVLDAPLSAPAGSVAIPLYGKQTPGRVADEVETRVGGVETVLRNITYPTLTPVLPDPAKANGSAVIVAPGGGFLMLSMQNEGWRVARALADRGVAAFVLKYRLEPTPRADKDFFSVLSKRLGDAARSSATAPHISHPPAVQDALAALKLVRGQACKWHIDPARVGMIGFSAGAITTLGAVLESSKQEGSGPNFIGYIYGPMNAVAVPVAAPPMFAAMAMDDQLFGKTDWALAGAWRDARHPVELHVYQKGGHGFGLGRPNTTTTLMMDEFLAWMDAQGLFTRKDKK